MTNKTDLNIKYFKITSLGESTFEWAPSRASILQDLQRAGALESDTIIEEVTEEQINVENKVMTTQVQQSVIQTPKLEPKFFTLPGGQKIKDDNGVLYSLEWRDYTRRQIIEGMGCEDIKLQEGYDTIAVLDWVKLEQEKEKNASKTDSDV